MSPETRFPPHAVSVINAPKIKILCIFLPVIVAKAPRFRMSPSAFCWGYYAIAAKGMQIKWHGDVRSYADGRTLRAALVETLCRPEYKTKQHPLTSKSDVSVFDAVARMSDKNYGSVVIVDDADKVIGVVTERDVMNKLVAKGRDPKTALLSDIMTPNPRLARETDDMLEWLRIMSNERFRRLPVVDDDGRIKAVFSQGDFVSYTWPDLMYQMKSMATATVTKNWPMFLIGGGIALYSLIMVVVVGMMN